MLNLVTADVVNSSFNEREKFFPSFLLCPETPKHTRGHCYRPWLLYSTHGHAKMSGLHNHGYTTRPDGFLNGNSNLFR